MAGWIKLYRDIQNCWIWNEDPFSRGQAFIDLLLMANHEDKKIMFNGNLIEVKRGSRITSIRQLSERWKWSSTKVKKFLDQLQLDNMITYKCDNKKTLLAIENYSVYQDIDNTEKYQKNIKSNTEITQKNIKKISKVNQKNTNKNDKEYIKNDKEGEERKEVKEGVPKLPPLSFPNPINKKIFDVVKEVGYRTWFIDASIEERDTKIIITEKQEFKRNIIRDRYAIKLRTWLGKEVEVKGEC